MEKNQFIVIGLGRFGSAVAKNLYQHGKEVLAIDKEEKIVNELQDKVTQAVIADATDEENLRSIGVKNFDVAVVAMGDDTHDSIMITLLLKELGVPYIIAKAADDMHVKVLLKVGADKVIQPENDMGIRVARNLVSTNIVDYIQLTKDYNIVEITVLKEWVGKTVMEVGFRKLYEINIMAVKKGEEIKINIGADYVVEENDVLIAIASSKTTDLQKMSKR